MRLLYEKAYQRGHNEGANSAYYLRHTLLDTLWDIARQMGFNGGNILEGSAGISNIWDRCLQTSGERSDIHAIRLTELQASSRSSILMPGGKYQGFEQTHIPNGRMDLAITNVPFVTGLRVNDTTGDKDLSKKFHNIQWFLYSKNVQTAWGRFGYLYHIQRYAW